MDVNRYYIKGANKQRRRHIKKSKKELPENMQKVK